jgi:hypothetical protein
MKQIANQKVRHTKNIPNGKAYRKVFNTYDICDYVFMNPLAEEKKDYLSRMTAYYNGGQTWDPWDWFDPIRWAKDYKWK